MLMPETDDIYFPQTREYFREVLSSYASGNYRSAIVMLYSVTIADLLYKLRELQDVYGDEKAIRLLDSINESRNDRSGRPKSEWEMKLIDQLYRETKLLDQDAYVNLLHLYDLRNLSAHPALNNDYLLQAPTQEKTIAYIKSTLSGVLAKPPIFMKNIIEHLTEDLKDKRDVFMGQFDKLQEYLNNRYFARMSSPRFLYQEES